MQELSQGREHSLTLVAREKLEISGVSDVKGFNEDTISVITDRGNLIVKGENLHI
ncbi:MAG: YabP/YqfC family sporulation protein, partial [Ruminococcus sp.]|nr:YabP/YqfC family sporulation protein [Ruminococcus sp.]